MDNRNRPVKGYCIYCKQKIYFDEPYVKSGDNLFHAKETEEHDNCYLLVIEGNED